jgi:uncharacterized membrane protein SpoIIM required for sporulation
MREAAFVKQNHHRWKEFEQLLKLGKQADPDKLSELFIQVTDDLSFSRTQYPESQTTQYLNDLASRIHLKIYENKREDKSRLITFWTEELPLIIWECRRPLLYSFAIFMLAGLIGWVSAIYDNTFVRLIMGDSYVTMTLNNIKDGNPTGVYAHQSALNMFFSITFNNVKVSFYAFAMGIFLSVGTGWVLFQNGVMVGSFLAFFYIEKVFNSALVVMLHGTLELSAIVIAGGAGLVMGNSILFPGTYSRFESFKLGSKKGLKIIVGLIPVFIMAGFIEGFLTRYATMPLVLKLFIVLGSAVFIIYYFIIYPIKKHRYAISTNH